jgi:hypothetical protein
MPVATLAQQMADRLFPGRNGWVVAAAYVETTFEKYAGSFPDTNGLPQVSATDAILVVEVEGWFPEAHRSPTPGGGAATSMVQAYDLTAGIDAGILYLFDPASPDVPGTSASAGQRFRELRQFGVPQLLVVKSSTASASP